MTQQPAASSPLATRPGLPSYYNEHDPFAAAWLRELIAANLIAPGDVDTRSIEDVTTADLRGYTQHHFFAGIGVWSYALRLAGWPDDRPVWTGSCPCQPFSAAGKRAATADARHLWPVWEGLVRECRPPVVIGEQVEGAVRLGWLDLVFGDLEDQGYACGAVVFGAHSVGAPHIRQRLYWLARRSLGEGGVADAYPPGRGVIGSSGLLDGGRPSLGDDPDGRGEVRGVADASGEQRQRELDGAPAGVQQQGALGGRDSPGGMADAARDGRREERQIGSWRALRDSPQGRPAGLGAGESDRLPHAPSSFWRDPDWLYCRDGRWRPVESGTFPLVDGAPARVGRLRGYGNAIVAEQAATFICAYLTC